MLSLKAMETLATDAEVNSCLSICCSSIFFNYPWFNFDSVLFDIHYHN